MILVLSGEGKTDLGELVFGTGEFKAGAMYMVIDKIIETSLKGFESANFKQGIAMLPKPKSEAWLICALKNSYQNCNNLENESGNDISPKSLKKQLEVYNLSNEQICEKIEKNEIDIEKIKMNSFEKFKSRLEEIINA